MSLALTRVCVKVFFLAVAMACTAMYIYCLIVGEPLRFVWWMLADCAAVGIEVLL